MENGEIRSHQLLATSSLPASRPDMARFNHDAWCAQTQDGNQFVQVIMIIQPVYPCSCSAQ